MRNSRAALEIASRAPEGQFPPPPSHLVGYSAQLWPGIREDQLLQAVAPLAHKAVLTLRCGQVQCAVTELSPVSRAASACSASHVKMRSIQVAGRCCLAEGVCRASLEALSTRPRICILTRSLLMLFLTTMAVLIGAASRESSKSLKFLNLGWTSWQMHAPYVDHTALTNCLVSLQVGRC